MMLPDFIKRRVGRFSTRSKAVGMFFATSLTARAIGVSCQLLQVPIAVKTLGTEAFGLWMTLTGIGTMIMFADFGVGQGAQNRLSEAFAAGRDDIARELWGSTVVFLSLVGLALGAGAFLVLHLVNCTALFNLADPAVRAAAPGAISASLLLYCVNFPLGMAQRLAYSRQKGWMHNVTQAINGAGSLTGVLIASHRGWGLAGMIVAAQLPAMLGNVGLMTIQLRQLGWQSLWPPPFRAQTMRELLALGACFGIQQVQLTLLISLPQVMISMNLGAAAVTPYNLAQRLFNLFAIIQNAFMLPLWPAYSDAKARGEFAWIRRTLLRSLGATLVCTILPMAVGAMLARPLLSLWVGPRAGLASPSLIWLLFAWNAIVFLQQPFGYMLAGISAVRRMTIYAVISTLLVSGLMYALVGRYAQEGVVIGMIVGYLPFFLFGNVAECARVFRSHFGPAGAARPAPIQDASASEIPLEPPVSGAAGFSK
jgi:O-antigen/teichoic acid export membrane protein